MEQKRALTSVDCAALVRELRSYRGAKLDKAYLYEDDLVRLKLRDFDAGRLELLAEVRDPKRVHLVAPEMVPDAPGRPPNFAMMLRNRLSGADLVDVRQFEFDRIISIEFERDDENTTLVFELFGDGNVAVLDPEREVVSSLDTVRLKSRTVAPGSTYDFPDSRFDPLQADQESFARRMAQSDSDIVRTVATQLNFGGLWAEELCRRAGVEMNKDIAAAEREEYDALYDAWDRLRARIKEGDLDPRVYTEAVETETGDDGGGDDEEVATDESSDGDTPRRVVDVTPVPMEEHEAAGLHAEAFDDFNEALADYFHRLEHESVGGGGGGGGGGRDRPDFESEIAKHERIIAQQEGAIEEFEQQAQREREKAELLYANYDLVDDVLSTVRDARAEDRSWDAIEERFAEGAERGIPAAEAVVGVSGAEGTVTLALDDHEVTVEVADGLEKNADRLYTEAKRIAEKKEGALAAIEDTREDLEAVKQRREEWEASDAAESGSVDEADEADETSDEEWLRRSSIPIRSDEKWFERFRWFHTSDDFLVIGGRNADQNEELVKKYMDRGDLFFHTQAHGGPVTVLKATGPSEAAQDIDIPERSKREAAQFAVAYSSVWKDGRYAGDAYMVSPDQVSKTPESGEYLEKGGFAVRGDRTYFEDVEAEVAVGIQVEPESRVVGGPPDPIEERTVTSIRLEPGQYAQNDIAKMIYREFRERFADQSFVRKVASADRVQEFCPPGGSTMVDE
ncbi:ribosome rescue protein RqcH [Haloglomus litoreum]|uniref:ribosome rescue protein RqcH n=1 Tax=Haloglomus litoreum TaxID=3034026 RepID=UPI0023E76E64|nr:ribosome rescue protein RqcH [Haloglomus sp. DT116]